VENGSDTDLYLYSGETITLLGVNAADLTAANFSGYVG